MSTPEQLIPESERKLQGAFETAETQAVSGVESAEQAPVSETPAVSSVDISIADNAEQTPEKIEIPKQGVKLNTAVPDFLDGKLTAGQLLEKKSTGELSAADLVNGLLNSRE